MVVEVPHQLSDEESLSFLPGWFWYWFYPPP